MTRHDQGTGTSRKHAQGTEEAHHGQPDQPRDRTVGRRTQAIYYDGAHSGHVLTHEQGRHDAATWADYINVGMEHGAFDMTGLAEYMRGLVDGGPTRSGHRTPAVIVEAPVNGTDEANVRYNAWQFRQILGRGVHGILLCQAETADAVRAFVEACRYPHHARGVDPRFRRPRLGLTGPAAARRRHQQAHCWGWHARPRLGDHRRADLGPVRGAYMDPATLAAQSAAANCCWG